MSVQAKPTRRKILSYKERNALIKAWGGKCAYCEVLVEDPVLDHIIPFSKGGACDFTNLAPTCSRCNQRKTDNDIPETYLALMLSLAAKKAKSAKMYLKVKKPAVKKVKTPKKKSLSGRRYVDILDTPEVVSGKVKTLFKLILENLNLDDGGNVTKTGNIPIKRFYEVGLEDGDWWNYSCNWDYKSEYFDDKQGDWDIEHLIQHCGSMICKEGGHVSFKVCDSFKSKVSTLLSEH